MVQSIRQYFLVFNFQEYYRVLYQKKNNPKMSPKITTIRLILIIYTSADLLPTRCTCFPVVNSIIVIFIKKAK